jgi:response regulator RpfG family c-di-GMP phosphodiesterase
MLNDEMRAALGLGLAMGATGVLIALATPSMHLYALPIFCIPLVLTQFAFRRYAAIRTTYRQTIRSLAQVTEVAGYATDGHSRRVAELAVALGRDLGLDSQRLLELEYAALMHDIGQISLHDPIDSATALAVTPAGRQRIAELGAEIIRTTGVLDRVAVLVGRQAEPYRRHREAPDASLPLESRIIKVASAYDDVVGDDTSLEARADGLERLRLGMVFDYDPRVVEALPRVLRRLDGRTRQFQF